MALPFAGKTNVFSSISRFWRRSYTADYVGLVLLLVSYTLSKMLMEPFHRLFHLDDPSIQFPHAEIERVPVNYLFLYAGGIPLATFILYTILFRPGLHKAHVTILGLFISIILTSFLTDLVKNSVGRPRPDLVARCKPERGTSQHDLVSWERCTETDHHTLHDGWRSFPSGHSSFAFSGLGYLALFFASQTHAFRPPTDLSKVLLVLTPLCGALLIAISRLEDYRHDVYDVTAGSTLGMTVAYFTYRRYYPRLKSSNCDTPYPKPTREAGSGGVGEGKRDEEMGGGRAEGNGRYSLDDLSEDGERLPLRHGDL